MKKNYNTSCVKDNKEATKYDKGKPPLSLIPRTALIQEAYGFAHGSKKYGKYNFKKGMAYTRIADSALRHIYSFVDGEDIDPETQVHNLALARCNMAMLLDFIDNGVGEDDRYDKIEVKKHRGTPSGRIKKSPSREQVSKKTIGTKRKRK